MKGPQTCRSLARRVCRKCRRTNRSPHWAGRPESGQLRTCSTNKNGSL